MLSNFSFLVLLILFVGVVAFMGSRWTNPNSDWFITLKKPDDYPSSKIFGIIWPILYILIIISTYIAYKNTSSNIGRTLIIITTIIQLILNVSWTYMFFQKENIEASSTILLLLLFSIFLQMTTFYFYSNSSSFALLLPYLFWIIYATYLNNTIMILN